MRASDAPTQKCAPRPNAVWLLASRRSMLVESSPLAAIAAELTGHADDDVAASQWIVRVVLSFVVWPPADPELEREMLRRFLAQPAPLPLSTR